MTRFQSPRAGVWLTAAALILLCGVAAAPLLTGQMPETADGAIHLYRLPILDHAFKDGSLFPRYPVATVYGYGSPLFSYYAPFSLYPMHVIHLFGVSYLNSWLIGMALYIVIGAGGAYLLGRTWGGGVVGVVAAAGFVYSPYFIYDTLWRGTTSETAALALLPFVLWSIKTQADHPSRRTFIAVILSLVLFIPMHNITTVHGGALIGVYAAFVAFTAKERVHASLRVFGALALGVLLATFFWYPAIRETPNIKIDAITAALPDIDVTRNLISAWSVFHAPYPADPSLQQPPFAIALGLPQLAFGILGLITSRKHPIRIRLLLILGTSGIALTVFMLTPASAAIWRAVPFIGYSQYPTRLLGIASLLLAVVAGFGVNHLTARALRLNGKMVRVAVPILIFVLFALPLTVRTVLPEHNPQSVVDALDFERESGFVGSSSFGEYVPIWTAEYPDTTTLRDQYAAHTFISRLREMDGVVVNSESWRNTSGELVVTAEAETTLTFDWLYLPYFQATVDGQPAEVFAASGDGRVQIRVPAGGHSVAVWLAPSRTQAIATLVSLMAMMATVGILGLWPLLRGRPAVAYVERFEVMRETRRALIAAALVGLVGLGAKAVFDRVPNPLRQERFASGYAAGVGTVSDANFGGEITLIGFDAPAGPVRADSNATLTLYWTPRIAEIERDYVTIFSLRTPDGVEVSKSDDERPGGLETHHWRQGQYVMQQAQIHVPIAIPPARYSLFVSLYDQETGMSLDVINTDGNPVGVEAALGTIEVSRGNRLELEGMMDIPTPQPGELPSFGYNWLFTEFAGIRVLGFNGIPETVSAGQEIILNGLWGLKSRQESVSFSIEWRLADDTVIGSSPLSLETPLPLAEWEIGDVWRLQHPVIVPALADGRVLIYLVEAGSGVVAIGETTAAAPVRTYELPADIEPLSARWENGIALEGYVQEESAVVVYWSARELMAVNLRRFAHVLAADGTMLQVIDGIPADWSRPVTGWLPGEIVADRLSVTLASDQTLRLGFYDTRTNMRVLVDGAEYIDLLLP